jgi:hypothetical protein
MSDDLNTDGISSGLVVVRGEEGARIRVTCEHQRGLIYVVPAERSWVCDSTHLPAHAMAGFFRELVALNSADVRRLMTEWGIYFRQLPTTGETAADAPAGATPS